ncbi:calcium-binding protein [Cognatilysobacter terrigena]|uniref:calcium-binding protein n=1 Tax=Cognatilysobacter terrigena TaxID=2488749 RepID=UPI0010609B42|nr:calcium-binding protein [Lysobacter terrigena]
MQPRRLIRALIASVVLTFAFAASATAPDRAIARAADAAVQQAQGHRLVLLADVHGTREIPLLVGDVVERLAAHEPVLLALEMPNEEQASLDAALAATDAHRARDVLLARAWWQRSTDQHDGRRSLGMLDLIERVRRLKHAGRDVALLAYDVSTGDTPSESSGRDGVMAERIRAAYTANTARRIVMLTGNFHAFLRIPSYMRAPVAITTAGMKLADLQPASIAIGAASGVGWGCMHDVCRAMPAPPASAHHEREYTGAVELPRMSVGRLVTVPTH